MVKMKSIRLFLIFVFIDSLRTRSISSENLLDRLCHGHQCEPNEMRRRRQIDFGVELLGEECESNDQCRRTPVDGSKVCFLNQCQCSPGYVPIDSYRCIRDLEEKSDGDEPPGYGSMCSTSNDCRNSMVKLECTRGTCVCLPGSVPLGKYLCYSFDGNDQDENEFEQSKTTEINAEHLDVRLGSLCNDDKFCQRIVDESRCENGRCVCREMFYQTDSLTCRPNEKRSLGGKCSTDDQCQTTNAICLEQICSCRKGFYSIDEWTCLEDDSDHSDEEIPMSSTTNVFRWWPWSSSSSTTSASILVDAKKTFRFRCLLNRQCASIDRNSHCTLFGRCICNNGFHIEMIDEKERCVEDDCD